MEINIKIESITLYRREDDNYWCFKVYAKTDLVDFSKVYAHKNITIAKRNLLNNLAKDILQQEFECRHVELMSLIEDTYHKGD